MQANSGSCADGDAEDDAYGGHDDDQEDDYENRTYCLLCCWCGPVLLVAVFDATAITTAIPIDVCTIVSYALYM